MIMDKKYFLPLMNQSVAGDSEENLQTFSEVSVIGSIVVKFKVW